MPEKEKADKSYNPDSESDLSDDETIPSVYETDEFDLEMTLQYVKHFTKLVQL